jgi:hypothetical protein
LNASTSLAPAILALCGVVLGGLITAGSNWWLALLREKVEQARLATAHKNEIKRAARLLRLELMVPMSIISYFSDTGVWYPQWHEGRSSGFWKEYAALMAQELPKEGWEALILAYTTLNSLVTNDKSTR